MKEDKTHINPLLEEEQTSGQGPQMAALREAIRQEEMTRPAMPADLNARLMQRVEKEVNCVKPARKSRIIWPWVAAACVAAVIAVFLTPPKPGVEGLGETGIARVDEDSARQQIEMTKDEDPQTLIASVTEEPIPSTVKEEQPTKATRLAIHEDNLIAQAEIAEDVQAEAGMPAEGSFSEMMARIFADKDTDARPQVADVPAAQPQPRVLTERDIPITRPENLKYTREELELMKRQANEAYLKWIELELEISKYNLEQTAER